MRRASSHDHHHKTLPRRTSCEPGHDQACPCWTRCSSLRAERLGAANVARPLGYVYTAERHLGCKRKSLPEVHVDTDRGRRQLPVEPTMKSLEPFPRQPHRVQRDCGR